MIVDSLENIERYQKVHICFPIIADFIKSIDLATLPLGRMDLADGCYLNVNEYETVLPEDCFIECHRKYIDLQIITRGIESVGVCPKDNCVKDDYDNDKDYQKLYGTVDYLTLRPGYFMIFFPEDGHMPMIRHINEVSLVKKLVFKIPANYLEHAILRDNKHGEN